MLILIRNTHLLTSPGQPSSTAIRDVNGLDRVMVMNSNYRASNVLLVLFADCYDFSGIRFGHT